MVYCNNAKLALTLSSVESFFHLFLQRDKGAPLMCLNEQGVWQLHGVLSREGECRTRPHPDVFASISLAKTWIENVIGFQ